MSNRIITYKEAVNEALHQSMENDSRVFVYGLDVGDHKGINGSTKGLPEKYGHNRCFSAPLSEDALMGFGIGAALTGLRPVNVHIRVDFLLLAMNQLINMASTMRYASGGKLKVPLTIRSLIGRGWGQGMQHSKSLQSFFAHIPGLKIAMPSRPADAKGLLLSAIEDENPVIILEHRWFYDTMGEVPLDFEQSKVPLGEALILREGTDATVIATSWMNVEALKAAEILEKRGVFIEVIDPRTIAPLDLNTILNSVRKTGHVLVADLDWTSCGFSAEVSALINENCFGQLKSPVSRVGFAPVPCPTTRPLENIFYPNAVTIIRELERKLGMKEMDLEGVEFYSYEKKFKGPF